MMDVKITTLKMPIEQIQNAILTVREAHDKLIALEALEERWARVISDAQAAVDEQARAAVEAIDAQVTPDGADIIGANEGDFALIRNGLVTNANQLARILAKHDNVAFRIAAARYASDPARMWEGFNFFDKENSLREYTEQVFNNLRTAVDRPHGPAYMQYADTPHEYSRIALAYGLANEYTTSGGDKLEEIYG